MREGSLRAYPPPARTGWSRPPYPVAPRRPRLAAGHESTTSRPPRRTRTGARGCNTSNQRAEKPRKSPARPFAPLIVTRLSQDSALDRPFEWLSGYHLRHARPHPCRQDYRTRRAERPDTHTRATRRHSRDPAHAPEAVLRQMNNLPISSSSDEYANAKHRENRHDQHIRRQFICASFARLRRRQIATQIATKGFPFRGTLLQLQVAGAFATSFATGFRCSCKLQVCKHDLLQGEEKYFY